MGRNSLTIQAILTNFKFDQNHPIDWISRTKTGQTLSKLCIL